MVASVWWPAHNSYAEWPVLEWRRQAFGATFRFAANSQNWLHSPIQWTDDVGVHAVHFLYDARGSCRVQAVLVFSGDALLTKRGQTPPNDPESPLGWAGNHLGLLDDQNGITVNQVPRHGLGISLRIEAGPADSELFLSAVGADAGLF